MQDGRYALQSVESSHAVHSNTGKIFPAGSGLKAGTYFYLTTIRSYGLRVPPRHWPPLLAKMPGPLQLPCGRRPEATWNDFVASARDTASKIARLCLVPWRLQCMPSVQVVPAWL